MINLLETSLLEQEIAPKRWQPEKAFQFQAAVSLRFLSRYQIPKNHKQLKPLSRQEKQLRIGNIETLGTSSLFKSNSGSFLEYSVLIDSQVEGLNFHDTPLISSVAADQ